MDLLEMTIDGLFWEYPSLRKKLVLQNSFWPNLLGSNISCLRDGLHDFDCGSFGCNQTYAFETTYMILLGFGQIYCRENYPILS